MQILVVDDKPEARYLLETLLRGNGFEVISAENGAEALKRLEPGGIELIVSDIFMPVMDGFQFCRKVKADGRLQHIPFVIYTATYTGPQDEEFAIKIGADRFILKPCEPDVFLAVIREVTASARHKDAVSAEEPPKEEEILKLYNERLVRKLEQKMMQAERELAARREMEKALLVSEDKFRYIFDHSTVGKSITLPAGEIKVNQTMCNMLGYSPAELKNKKWQDITHPDDIQLTHKMLEPIYAGQSDSTRFIKRYLKKNGSIVWADVSTCLRRDRQGKPLYFITSALDITERKRVEEEMIRIQKAVEDSGDAVGMTDAQGRHFYQNKAFTKLFGYSVEDLKDPFKAVIVFTDQTVGRRVFETIMNGGSWKNEIEMTAKNGLVIPVSGRADAVKDSDGKVIGLIGVFTDITERKRAENAIRESEEKYRQLAENCPFGIVMGTLDGQFVYANPSILRILGVKETKEILSRPLNDWLTPQSYALLKDEMERRVRREKVPDLLQLDIIRPNGDIRTLEISRSEIFLNKQMVVQAVIADISERKRAEAEIMRANKLESLAVLAGGIAHDFNNILTGITANISFAKHQLKPGDDIFELIDDAERAAGRAKDLIRQLLTFAKGGIPVKEKTSIAGLIRESANFVLSGSNIKCSFFLPDDLWQIEADPGRIYQVFENLVINAKQAMEKGGIIEIRAENVKAGQNETLPLKEFKRCIKISVKDQGTGIPEENLQKIFDPYFTTKAEGSGLGLATTYSIVKKHGGHISVESKVGEGTIFHIFLPCVESWKNEKQPEVQAEGDPGRISNNKGTILILDDEESIRRTLGRLLEYLQFEVRFASRGEEVIEILFQAEKDGKFIKAVIMDLTIPGGMGGKETAGIIRKSGRDIELIASSGYSDTELMANYKEYGFDGVLIKPYTINELQEKLGRVMNGK